MSSLKINSNLASLNAQRNFGVATKKLAESYTRLSSGLRINKSSDDAAGLSISESLKADTRLFNQGVRNLNDGIGLISIADGALRELSNITIRLRELATQSANGTLGTKQRMALDQEAQSLAKEYNRIARSTEFNGRKVFDGDFGELSLAAGGGIATLIKGGLGGGIGDGSFQSGTAFAGGDLAYNVDIVDMNSDGISDIVATGYASNVSVSIGNGDGTFKAEINHNFNTGSLTNFPAYADFNSDGNKDMVLALADVDSVVVLLGNGNGTFKNQATFFVGDYPNNYSVTVGDFNGDSIEDIATRDLGNTLRIFAGNGNGTFSNVNNITSVTNSHTIHAADLNNDGLSDLLQADPNSSAVYVMLATGNHGFGPATSYSSVAANAPSSISVADFNEDGYLDFSTGPNAVHGMMAVYLNTGNGTFVETNAINALGITIDVTTGDFNGDGHVDLAASGSSISVLLGNGNGSFKAKTTFVSGTVVTNLAAGDINGDGVYDFIAADYPGNARNIHLGNSDEGVSALQYFSLKSKDSAKDAIGYFAGALNRISKQRGKIGAFQSRVDAAVNVLRTGALNFNDANSRITDTDIAEESAKLTANQIVQQAAASVLAQANQQPRLVLQLLGGV